jgi:OmcA/MtrC family decaheme c-type cytochrome
LILRDLQTGQVVYESHAAQEGSWSDSRRIFPAMFAAALSGFPADGHKFAVTLVNVTADATGKPTFTVDVSLDNLPFDIKGVLTAPSVSAGRVATCAFQVAGPTTDYVIPATGGTAQSCTSAAAWTAVPAGDTATSKRFTFSSGTFFAGKADGYYTAAFEIMWQRVTVASNGDYVRKPSSANPNFLLVKKAADLSATTVTDAVEAGLNGRRSVVEFDKCNNCHVDLGFHSNRNRKGPDYCATCHNPKLDNFGRARVTVAEATTIPGTSTPGYLPESVSLNVFIHRIHMGGDLPSVAAANTASPWVPNPGQIMYGATRSAFTGNTNTTPPDRSDFSEFAMPNPMVNCAQCHISSGAQQTWALNEGAGLAPIERTWKVCNAVTPSWATEPWCDATSASSAGMPKYTGPGALVVTPPLKAVCTSCHDDAATNTHADLYTVNPMTAGASEMCATCHGAGKDWDVLLVHKPVY